MLISNPLTNELFAPLSITLSGLLAFGLLGVLLAGMIGKNKELNKQMLRRWFSWSMITPITLLCVLSGPFALAILAALVSFICSKEYCTITKRTAAEGTILAVAAALIPLLACFAPQLLGGACIAMAMLLAFLSMKTAQNFESACVSLIALFYVPFLASHTVLLDKAAGPGLLISIICSSALANIVAFAFGKLLGGPKLAEGISPNKTWSGVAGSAAGAYFGFMLLSSICNLQIGLGLKLIIPLVVAAAGTLGDLFESLLKRSFQVKDAGSWLPGFGGALDRVDGLLFVVPCVYYIFSAVV